MITITTTSTQDISGCLTTIKEELKITDSENDSLLDGLLRVATDLVEKEVGYSLFKQSYQETVPAYGSINLLVKQRPLVSIDSVWQGTDSGSPLSTDEYYIDDADAGIIQRTTPWQWHYRAENRLDIAPIRGEETSKAYTVNYDAGFVYPGTTDDPRTLPRAIEQATHELTKYFYKNRDRNAAVSMKKIGDLTIEYGSRQGGNADELPSSIKILLQPYRSLT